MAAGLKLDHIGIIMKDLDYEAIAAYQGLSKEAAMAQVKWIRCDQLGSKLYLVGSVEAIVPLDGSPYSEHLKKLGRSSAWHHMGMRAPVSLEESAKALESLGYKPDCPEYETPAGRALLYRVSRQTLLELLEPAEPVEELLAEARAAATSIAPPPTEKPAAKPVKKKVVEPEPATQGRLVDAPLDPGAPAQLPKQKKAPPFASPRGAR